MGEVYAAELVDDPVTRVAVKFLMPMWACDRDALRRFQREAEIAQRLNTEYVAQFVSAGFDRAERLWIAFELLEGDSLERLLGPTPSMILTEHDVGWIVDDVLQGLEHAHDAKIIHRDLKPSNIFIETTADGKRRARILDFGVSKLRERVVAGGQSTLTAIGDTVGTPSYMPPEQIGGAADVDERADIYALGVVIYRALTGVLPFAEAGGPALVEWKRSFDPLTLADTTGSAWGQAIEEFVATAIARQPSKRFPSARAAHAAWQEIRPNLGTSRLGPRRGAGRSLNDDSTTEPQPTDPEGGRRGS